MSDRFTASTAAAGGKPPLAGKTRTHEASANMRRLVLFAKRAVGRDPLGTTLLAGAVIVGLAAGGPPALVPAAVAVVIGTALFRFGGGEYTAWRLFGTALLVRNAALMAVSVLAGGANFPIFPDEAQYTKITLEAALRLFGRDFSALPAQIASMAGPDGLRRFSEDGFAYLLSPLSALVGPEGTLTALRSATAVCGALSVSALWWAGSRLAGRRAARRAAVAYAFFPTSVFWSAMALKEAAASALVLASLGMVAKVGTGRWPSWLRWVPGLWVVWFLLLSIREHLAFVAAATAVLGVIALRWTSADSMRRSSALARLRPLVAAVAAVIAVASTALWASGYGVLGKDVIHTLDPSFLEQRVQMETKGGAKIAPATTEPSEPTLSASAEKPKPSTSTASDRSLAASSFPEVRSEDKDRIGRLLRRLPAAATAVALRPYPWEVPQGALGRYAGASRLFIFPSQLLWYLALVLGLLGAWRLFRRHPAHGLHLVSFPAVVLFFYGLTQANLGTAFRLREVFVPLVLLAAAVPQHRGHRDASRSGERGGLLFVLPTTGPGGTERHVLEVASHLRDNGQDVRVIVLRDLEASGSGDRPLPLPEGILCSAGRKARYDLWLPLRLARLMGRPRCVSTYLFAGNFWGGVAARFAGSPLVSNVRTTHPRSLLQRMLEPLVAGEIVLCNSEAVAESALRRGMPPSRVRVVHNGVDVDALRASVKRNRTEVLADLGIPPESFVVCCPARFDPLKDQLTAVEAFRKSSLASRPDVYLVLAGSSALAAERRYRQDVARASADLERVVLVDFYHPLAELLAACDVVLLSSIHEGMPNVLLEAGALGKPAVATRAGGSAEVISDGDSGILVDPKDPEALSKALDAIAEDKGGRARMGQSALRRVRQRFSIDAEIEGFMEAISECFKIAEDWDEPETETSRRVA